ncbi:MAG: hypothetical protein IKY38_01545, partial [Anaerotignum sp.]|nr:hypothetical protein [Anaerotignum sp.]
MQKEGDSSLFFFWNIFICSVLWYTYPKIYLFERKGMMKMADKIRIGILGYGNLGKGVELAVRQN